MDIYLLPKSEDYVLISKIDKKEYRGFGKGLVEKFKKYEEKQKDKNNLRAKAIKYFRKKLETKQERILKHANQSKELVLKYPSSMDHDELKKQLKKIAYDKRKKRMIGTVTYGALTPITFVAAPFLPVLNWGFTAFFLYRFIVNYNALKGSTKLLEKCKYIPDDNLSRLEKILLEEKDYSKIKEEFKNSEYDFLIEHYITKDSKQ